MSNDPKQDEKLNKIEAEQGPHQSLTGSKVDADLDEEKDRPADEGNLVTQESQKGKKVDADPEEEADEPTAVE